MGRHDDDRERRSWRDIDRKKDQSSHIDRTDPYKKSKRGAFPEEIRRRYVGEEVEDVWICYPWDARDIDFQDRQARGG